MKKKRQDKPTPSPLKKTQKNPNQSINQNNLFVLNNGEAKTTLFYFHTSATLTRLKLQSEKDKADILMLQRK